MSEAEPAGEVRQGPGCLPGCLAATLLLGIVAFVGFGFSAWLIFQKRPELASRTLRATVVPQLEQSRLGEEEKLKVISQLKTLADDLDAGLYENWQASGIMQRLIESPMMRWGDLATIDVWIDERLPEGERVAAHQELSRFRRAAELDLANSRDAYDVLAPVAGVENAVGFTELKGDPTEEELRRVIERAKLIGDRAKVATGVEHRVSLAEIIRRLIEVGRREGGK